MKVAVVANTHQEAVHLAATLGMTKVAVPLRAEEDALLGHRFDAVLLVARKALRDLDWWADLTRRTHGPIYTLDEWGGR